MRLGLRLWWHRPDDLMLCFSVQVSDMTKGADLQTIIPIAFNVLHPYFNLAHVILDYAYLSGVFCLYI